MKYEVKIKNMNCNHCVKKITNILNNYGINVIHVNLEQKIIYVDNDILKYPQLINELEEFEYFVEYSKNIQ
ncbi:MAG TPA: heavy-metal-associated domain-containing protein [Ignavibacteriales bacterium]|nr:heavy-metal-associated domain-containing protein [Ignavibacteriales bacterium]HOL81060.1 heavy-metal-associated domain-containing protein [Ignavibacteriales bacterium]HPP32840.1 heavy-metal-associated domain-containing protein [Ignavibacteriales bacterium]